MKIIGKTRRAFARTGFGTLVLSGLLPAAMQTAQAEPLPYDRTHPVVFVNDIANDVYTHELNMALIASGQVPNWKAIVVSGSNHPNGWQYQYNSEFNQFQDLSGRARDSGFSFVPEPLRGGGTGLARPGSGVYEETIPVSSAGVEAILDHARAATPEQPLVVVVGGPITAPVSAYLMDNAIADNMIVAWLAYNSGVFGPEYSPDPNVEMDAWAAEIALQRLKLVIFPVHRDPPVVGKARINSDLPDTPLRQAMASKTVYSTDRDDDAQPSVSLLAATSYPINTTRVRFSGQHGSWGAPLIVADASGPHIYLLDGDQSAGTSVWWNAVQAAFDGVIDPPPPPPPPPPSGGDYFRFYPRDNLAFRMVGGKFQGSNTSAGSGFVDLATIAGAPAQGGWTELSSAGDVGAYRYLRYLSPDNGFGNVAEIEFYDDGVKQTGTLLGSPGSWNNSGNTFDKALDGNTATFFDAPSGNGQYAGIDTGDVSTPPPPPAEPSWEYCAAEYQFCGFSGTRTVRYGTGNNWAVRELTAQNGGVACGNAVFGDPAVGVVKYCELATPESNPEPDPEPEPEPEPDPDPDPHTNWIKIADEWNAFVVDGTRQVRYGAGTTWIEKTVTGGGDCTNIFFGSDPLPGVTKQCQVANAVTVPPPGIRAACILPLGDSITQGDASHYSYRYRLWERLAAVGSDVNFVGTLAENFGGTPLYPNAAFDRDHEGHWGCRVDEVNAQLPGWLNRYPIGFALVHLGTNDILQGQSVQETLAEMSQLIDLLRRKNSGVTILLAQVIPTTWSGNDLLMQFNAGLADLALSKNLSTSPVIAVDQAAGFDAQADTFDGVHPNESGEQKMADRWFEVLAPLLENADPC